MKRFLLALLCLILVGTLFGAGQKEVSQVVDLSNYPSRTINFIVNRAAGGASDLVARAVANKIQEVKGHTTAVINIDGGDGLIGVNELMRANPDGYTFCVIGSAEIPNMLANFDEAQFTKEDLLPVAQIAARSRLMIAKPNSPFKTLEDLKTYGQANPGAITVAVPGSNNIYIPELIGEEMGIEFTIINAGSGNAAFTMLLGGHVDTAVIGSNFYPNARAENLTVLADSNPTRVPVEGGAPTFLMQGYDVTDTAFIYILASKGMPEEYIKYMSSMVQELTEAGALAEGIRNANQELAFMPYEEFAPFFINFNNRMISILAK